MRQIKSSSAHEKNAHTKQETIARPIKKTGTICAVLPIVPIKRQPIEKMSHWQMTAAKKSARRQNESERPSARVQVRRRGLAQQRKSTDLCPTARTKEPVRCIDSQQERNLWQVWCQKRLLHLKGCSLCCRFQQFETVHYAPKQEFIYKFV